MANTDYFSMSTVLNSLQDLRYAAATEPITENYPAILPPPSCFPVTTIPPPGFATLIHSCPCGFCAALTPQELQMRLQWMFNFMTKAEGEDDVPPFKETVSKLRKGDVQEMACLLTSDYDYFLEIARIKNGSHRIQKLLGKSVDADDLFCAAILYRFLDVMTDKYASYVVTRGFQVFDEEKKDYMCEQLIRHALHLASDPYGCIALNEIITDLDHPNYRNLLLDIIAHNALWLSNDATGNFVVQHVLQLNDSRTTRNVALSLRGQCIDLSFKKYGSYIVERLLDADDSVAVVVMELLESDGDRLMRLARSEFGNFVVSKALKVTQKKMTRVDLFRGLVDKLMPFLHLLHKSRRSNIAAILESIPKI